MKELCFGKERLDIKKQVSLGVNDCQKSLKIYKNSYHILIEPLCFNSIKKPLKERFLSSGPA